MFKNTIRLTSFFSGLAALALLPLVSCQVGLGSSVDTEAPTLEITYPPASAVIRGQFVLAGTCSDDQGISTIAVTVTNTDNKTKAYTYTASADATGKAWSVNLNKKDDASGYPFPDGKYEIAVTAKDGAGHTSGTSSRAVEIDNTAPVFILKSPGSASISSPTAYGANFKITGTIADDHTIKTMAVTVYDESGAAIGGTDTAPFTASNVETAGGTSVTIAKYLSDGTEAVNTNYVTLYGQVTASNRSTKKYTCTITLTDSAKEYTDQSVSDDKNTTAGNTTATFYLSDDVQKTLAADSLEAGDVKKILNGTYTGSSDIQAAVKTLFTEKAKTTAAFSLNPDASPKYSITGYKFTDIVKGTTSAATTAITDNAASSAQKVTVVATAGLDGTYVNPATLVVYQFGPFASAAQTQTAISEIYTDPASYAAANASVSHTLKNESGAYDNTSYSSGTVETYTYPVYLYDTIETGRYYVIAVTGQDAEDIDITPQDGARYGFTGAVSGNPPSIEWGTYSSPVTNIGDLQYTNTGALSFSGTASSASSTIKSVAYEIVVTDESSSGSGAIIRTLSGTAAPSDGSFNAASEQWTFNAADAAGYAAIQSGKEYLYTVDVTASDENGNTFTRERRIHIDTVQPSVSITSVTPVVTNCVNGKVTITASVSDTNLASSSYTVYVDGSPVSSLIDIPLTGYSPSVTIDTRSLADQKQFYVVISAKDKAGNTQSDSGTNNTTNYNNGTPLTIDQRTDAPQVSLSNADISLLTAVGIKNAYTGKASKTNIFGTASNNKLLGTITDDDGIASVTIAYDTDPEGPYTNTIYSNKTVGGTTSFSIPDASFSKLSEGLYYLKITAKDKLNDTGYAEYKTSYFAVAVDNGAPQFSSITPANGGYYSASKPLTVKGTISDASGQVTLQKAGSSGTSAQYAVPVTKDSVTMTLADIVTPPETDGSYTLLYTATDRYGQSSTYEISYIVDKTPPAYIATLDSDEHTTKSTAQAVQLTVSDQCKADGTPYGSVFTSGIASVTYKIDDTKGTGNQGTLNYAEQCTGNANQNINTYFAVYKGTLLLTDSVTNTVTFTITDGAGNATTVTQQPIYTVDAAVPVINIDSYNTTSSESGNLTFNVTASDNKAISTITIGASDDAETAIKGTDYAVSTTAGKTDDVAHLYRTITILGSGRHDGNWTFTINAQDKAGWPAEQKAINVQVDSKAPVVSAKATINNATADNGIYYLKKTSGCTIKGTTTDAVSGIDKVYAAVVFKTAPVPAFNDATWSIIDTNPRTGTWSYTLDTTSAHDISNNSIQDNTEYTVYTVATDVLGNKTVPNAADTSVSFFADAGAPVFAFSTSGGTITETGSAETGRIYNATYYRSASASITGTITDSAFSTMSYAVTTDPNADASTSVHTEAAASGGTWSIEPVANTSGTYVYTFTASDKAGYNSKAVITVIVDKSAPTVTISNANASTASKLLSDTTITETNAYYSTDGTHHYYTVSGTWTDDQNGTAGTGTDKLYYTTSATAGTITGDASTGWKDCGATTSVSGTTNWSITIPVEEGTGKYIAFYAVDKAGNASHPKQFTDLKYDFSAPVASFETITPHIYNYGNKGQQITVTGTVSDSYRIGTYNTLTPKAYRNGAEVSLTQTGSTWRNSTYGLDIASTDGETTDTVAFKLTIPASQGTNDGNWTFSLAGKDASGRESNAAATSANQIIIDTVAPSLTVTNATGDTVNLITNKLITEEDSSYKKSGAQNYYVLSGKWSDALTGTKTLEYSTNGNTWTPVSDVSQTTVETAWSVQVPISEGKDKQLQIRATDTAGNVSALVDNTTSFTGLTFDFGRPVLAMEAIAEYIKDGGTLTLKGTYSDTDGMATAPVSVEAKRNGTTISNGSDGFNYTSGSGKVTITLAGNGSNDGTWTFSVTATDIANRTTTVTGLSTKVDTHAPEISTLTAKGITPATNVYYKETSLAIAGTFKEYTAYDSTDGYTGSGIEKIYYQIGSNTFDENTYITPGSSLTSGTFSTSFSTILAGFEGNKTNTLYIKAKDYAGNESDVTPYTINIDQESPSVAASTYSFDGGSTTAAITGTILTNQQHDMTLSGTCSDTMSGVALVKTFVGSAVAGTVTYTETDGKKTGWKSVIPKENLSNAQVYAEVSDNAGNIYKIALFALAVDTKSPAASLSSPATTSKLNGTVTFKGTAYDDLVSSGDKKGALARVSIYYSTTDSTVATMDDSHLIGSTTGTDMYSWSFSKAVSGTANAILPVSSADETLPLYIRIKAEDTAANIYTSGVSAFTIDRNSDRPVITIVSLDASTSVLQGDTIKGSVTDDDGIETLKISESAVADAAGWSGISAVTTESGMWSYVLKNSADGSKALYFYIKDTAGTEFYYNSTSQYARPYYKYSKDTDVKDCNTPVVFVKDQTNPGLESGQIAVNSGTVTNMTSATIIGGSQNSFILSVKASDANGIQSVSASLDGVMLSGNGAMTCEDAIYKDGSNHIWKTGTCSVSSIQSAVKQLVFTAIDNSGNKNTLTYTIQIDNTKPSWTVTTPKSSEEMTSTVTLSGTMSDSVDSGLSGSGINSIKYYIPKYNERTASETALAGYTWGGKNAEEGATASWKYAFDGTNNKLLSYYTSSTDYFSTTEINAGIFAIPVYFRIEDNTGNIRYITDYTVKYNPDADKPKTTIIYPTSSDYDKGEAYVTLGGTIRMNGSVEIPSGTTTVKTVYIQVAAESSTFNDTDKVKAGTGTGNYGYTVVSSSGAGITTGWTSDMTETSWWGIAATRTASTWYINLNTSGTMNPGETGTNNIKVRACAVNDNGKIGAWSDTYVIHIDKSAPTASAALKQYSGIPTQAGTTEKAGLTYTPDMYIKGAWYLVVTVSDESGIITGPSDTNTLSVQKDSTSLIRGSNYYLSDEFTENGRKGYYVYIPVTADSGKATYTITATDTDGSAHTINPSYTLNIDNTAPVMGALKGNGTEVTAQIPVQNNNYIYQFDNTLTETGSGFARAVFYFIRNTSNVRTTGTECLFDPMLDTGRNSSANRAKLSTLDSDTITQDTLHTYTLYGKKLPISQSSTTVLAVTDINEHIRQGGLIKIGGVYRTIQKLEGSTITLDSETSGTGSTEAFFPYAQVADNTSTETRTSDLSQGSFTITNDDGDGMPETVIRTGSTWDWSTAIYSNNMPDGPVTIVCLVFDKAGNVTGTSVSTKITNNAPRLAKVHFGTDLSGDSAYSQNEFITYDIKTKTGSYASAATVDTKTYTGSPFIIKDTLAVVPEFTGGNGSIGMIFNNKASGITAATGTVRNPDESFTTAGIAGTVLSTSFAKEKNNTLYGYKLSNADLNANSVTDGTAKGMSFTFWDSTEETTQGSTSLNCVLYVDDFTLDLVDNVKPNAVIAPFFWNSAAQNSLYGNSSANGHIELEADWKNAAGYSGSATSGTADADPKVSGKITLRGYAYDDVRLGSLWAYFGGIAAGTKLTTATNFGTSGVNTVSGSTYYEMAEFNSSTGWTGSEGTVSGASWKFTVYTAVPANETAAMYGTSTAPYFGQDGHKVFWQLDIDTSGLSTVAAADVYARVLAVDHLTGTGNSSAVDATGAAGDTTYNKPYYKMDVVPYITGIKTFISSNAGDEFARSALGYYSVYAGESVTVNGFNLKSGTTAPTITLNGTTQTVTDSSTTSVTTTVGTAATSGEMKITVSGIGSLNNSNASPTFADGGTEPTGGALYNSRANSTNNNRLTDDIKLYVWNMGKFLTDTNITSPMMKMDATGNYYMSYGYGVPSMYVKKNDTITEVDYSYNKFHNTNVAYDAAGNIYAVATNTDRIDDDSAKFCFYSGPVNVADGNTNYYSGRSNSAYQYSWSGKNLLETVFNTETGVYDINRVKTPKMQAYGSGTDSCIVMSYYDENHTKLPVKFRYGTASGGGFVYTSGGTSYTFTQTSGAKTVTLANQTTNNLFNTGTYLKVGTSYVLISNVDKSSTGQWNNRKYSYTLTLDLTDNFTSSNTLTSEVYTGSTQDISLTGGISGNTSGTAEDDSDLTVSTGSAANYHIVADNGTDMTYNGGAYTAVGAVKKSNGSYVGIVAWYDAKHKQLVYSYNEAPNTPVRGGVWQTNAKVIDASYAGWYVDMCVDSSNGIHIAYYSTGKGDLKYAYLPSYNCDASAIKVVTVDSYLSAGTQISINTRDETVGTTTYIVPYISYYHASFAQSPSSVRIAWMPQAIVKGGTATVSNGAVSDKFTQKWEVAAIPTTNIPNDALICNGVPTSGTYAKTPVLGYMSDAGYEKAYIQY